MTMTFWQWIQVATAIKRRWLRWRRDRRRARIEAAARGCPDFPTDTETPTETDNG